MLRAVRGPILIIVLIALLLTALWSWMRTSLPELEGREELPGLARAVEISRDDFGVPRIEAESLEDLYYVLGFTHAQDRLWQMEYRRLKAAGRLAELLGEKELDSDLLMRTLGLQEAAERDMARLGARTSGTLQAYSDGVNAFLATHRGALPIEFQLLGHTPTEWTPVDVALLQKLTSWEWTEAAASELFRTRLAATLDEDELAVLLDGGEVLRSERQAYGELPIARLHELLAASSGQFAGTQAWAVAGERSVDGAPILATEFHGRLTAPAPWYPVRLVAPGLNLAGATLPGMPLVFSGRNEDIAWSLVPLSRDNKDLFLERLEDSDRPAGYLTTSGVREFETRRELIEVRGGGDVELIVRATVNGPVVSDLASATEEIGDREPRLLLSLAWTGLEEGDGTIEAALALQSASNWQEFRNGLSNLDELHGAVVYADAEGRIGWQSVGRLPERAGGAGELPSPAWGSDVGWEQWIPSTRLEGTLEPADGQLLIGDAEAAGEELLGTVGAHTVSSAARILGIEFLPGSDSLLPTLRRTLPVTELAGRAHGELVGWSGELDESAAPLVYSGWLRELARELLSDELGAELAAGMTSCPGSIVRALSEEGWCDDRSTDEVESCSLISSRALSAGVATLAERYGPQLFEWPAHPALRVSYEHPVFEGTLLESLFRVGREEQGAEEVVRFDNGPVYLAVYQLSGDRGSSGFLIPTGPAGNPLSPYYRNMVERWQRLQLLPLQPEGSNEEKRLLLEPRR